MTSRVIRYTSLFWLLMMWCKKVGNVACISEDINKNPAVKNFFTAFAREFRRLRLLSQGERFFSASKTGEEKL